jgi:DNA replication and repair protein RecF
LFGQFSNHKVGISRTSNHTNQIRINGQASRKLSDLAKLSPVRVLNSSCMNLVTGKPSYKREFIDWCLFHVEHCFQELWLKHVHALKQKNVLLKNKSDLKQIDYWDTYLAEYNESIFTLRNSYIDQLIQILHLDLNKVFRSDYFRIVYEPGWNINKSLSDLYQQSREKELKYGYSLLGSQRDNILIYYKDVLVQNILSRGQLKKLAITLYIAQIILVTRLSNKQVVVLLDDLHAELDKISVSTILDILSEFNIQVFFSAIELRDYMIIPGQEFKLFHVEHGIIRAIKNT